MAAAESAGRADNLAELGARMLAGFKQKLAGCKSVVAIRGKGLMLAIELNQNAGPIKDAALEKGILFNVTKDTVIRMLPPMILTDEQADTIVDSVSELILSHS